MFWLVAGIILFLIGAIASLVMFEGGGRIAGVIGAALVGVLVFLPGMIYSQDVGEAKVLKNVSGSVVGSDVTSGFSTKAPWVSTVDYDIRNQQVTFRGAGDRKEDNGAEITIQDKEGVSANIDINVRYSVNPDKVEEIHAQYLTQENFVSRFIENDIRAGVRAVPSNYTTLGLMGGRTQVESDIRKYLEERWETAGVLVESVSLQDIRYPEEVKQRFSDAQNARTDVEKARAQLDATKVSAEQQVVQAEAAAKANNLLAQSLTPEVLQYKQLETLEKVGAAGNTIVVPQGTTPFVQVPPPAPKAEEAK